MAERNMLNEAYALTVEVLVMAATSLLVVELGAHADGVIDRVRKSSRKARQLLETLSRESCSAAGCLESLRVSPLCRQNEMHELLAKRMS